MHAKLNPVTLMALVVSCLIGVFAVTTARAVEVDTEIAYDGTGTTTATIFDDNTAPIDLPNLVVTDLGQISFGATVAVNLSNHLQPRADLHLEAPDGAVVEGETVPVTLKLTAKDGTVKEFVLDGGLTFKVRFGYDDDENGLNCAFFPVTGGDGTDDTCQEYDLAALVGLGTVNLFTEDMTAPYAGNTYAPPEASTTLAKVPVCSLLIGLDVCSVDIIGVMNSLLSATAGPGGGPTAAVTNPGFHSDRSILVGATAGPTTPLTFPDANQMVDNVAIACGGSPGSTVSYKLSNNGYDARLTELTFGIDLTIEIQDPVPDIGPFNLFTVNVLPLFDHPLNVFTTAPDFQVALGTYQAEQIPPTIDSNSTSPNPGIEGSAIAFTATAHDNCPGALTYRWDFSDGGVAFGSTANHTFADNGTFTYPLSVRDLRGNVGIANGSVVVDNAVPIANAGPDAIEAWGINIPFNGQAVDPGAGDQSTLSYEWDFGDNSPKGHALNVLHAYTTPGNYVATLKVCDKDGACGTDSRQVTVRKRNTSLGYLGDHNWTFDTQIHLTGSLTDEFGGLVNGRQVDFSIDATPVTSASTSSAGIADRAYQVVQTAGGHSVAAAFAGDSLYEASSSTDSSVVTVKATSVTYTGALTGGPNKTITLSAILKDSDGKPLSGRTIDFQLGSQSVSAVTDAQGVATISLKLAQKNGTYPLTATFTPSGADASMYAGSGSSNTFKLQAK